MTLETVLKDHLKTQRKINTNARDRHFESKGRWEGEKSLAQTIQDIEDRLTEIEETLKGNNNDE